MGISYRLMAFARAWAPAFGAGVLGGLIGALLSSWWGARRRKREARARLASLALSMCERLVTAFVWCVRAVRQAKIAHSFELTQFPGLPEAEELSTLAMLSPDPGFSGLITRLRAEFQEVSESTPLYRELQGLHVRALGTNPGSTRSGVEGALAQYRDQIIRAFEGAEGETYLHMALDLQSLLSSCREMRELRDEPRVEALVQIFDAARAAKAQLDEGADPGEVSTRAFDPTLRERLAE